MIQTALVLEDLDARYAAVASALFTAGARSVARARTATECIAELTARQFDVVLLDHDLDCDGDVQPHMGVVGTGMEVVEWLVGCASPPCRLVLVHSKNIPAAEAMVSRLAAAGYVAHHTPASPFSYDTSQIVEALTQ